MMSWQCGFEIKNQQSTFQTADVPSELDLNGIVLRTHRQPRNNGPATVLLCMYEILCIVVLVAIKEVGGGLSPRGIGTGGTNDRSDPEIRSTVNLWSDRRRNCK